jgi:hypothetical protein
LEGLGRAQIDAIVRYTAADGTVTTQALREGASTFTVPGGSEAPRSRAAIASGYLRAGVDHILRGWDHLLFVLGLLLLVKRLGPLVRAITAFTLAHSLTLALSVAGAVAVPQAPAEALVALSLMLLAVELARPAEAEPIARQRPWSMVFVFGLVHGFGFAGALRELGLPAGEVPLALFAFNVGVECGQVAFVLAALGITWIARRSARGLRSSRARENDERGVAQRYLERAAAYAIGAVSAFWFFERLAKLGS